MTPWTVAHQALLFMEFSRQEYRSVLPCPPTEDLSDPGIEPGLPALQVDSLPSEPPGKALEALGGSQKGGVLFRIFAFFLIYFFKLVGG